MKIIKGASSLLAQWKVDYVCLWIRRRDERHLLLLYYYVKRLIVWTWKPANRKKLGYLERIILFTVVRQSSTAEQSDHKRHTSITEVMFYQSNCILVSKQRPLSSPVYPNASSHLRFCSQSQDQIPPSEPYRDAWTFLMINFIPQNKTSKARCNTIAPAPFPHFSISPSEIKGQCR